ncbi:unnamed protein product [Rotaria magnacalcarata]|uniref:WWE domain-containing protein n=1 Tax=Rotaria magnacalcarata TaxID=392030 RepID=A0A8S3ARL5_9BILA|nr:unnamed protein product [Rotaria magnacalcarata]
MNENEGWTSYSDIESQIIDDTFKKNSKTIRVQLDDWWIDLEKLIAISKHDSNKQMPIKPKTIQSQQQRLTQERFTSALSNKPFNEWTYGGHFFIKQWKEKTI